MSLNLPPQIPRSVSLEMPRSDFQNGLYDVSHSLGGTFSLPSSFFQYNDFSDSSDTDSTSQSTSSGGTTSNISEASSSAVSDNCKSRFDVPVQTEREGNSTGFTKDMSRDEKDMGKVANNSQAKAQHFNTSENEVIYFEKARDSQSSASLDPKTNKKSTSAATTGTQSTTDCLNMTANWWDSYDVRLITNSEPTTRHIAPVAYEFVPKERSAVGESGANSEKQNNTDENIVYHKDRICSMSDGLLAHANWKVVGVEDQSASSLCVNVGSDAGNSSAIDSGKGEPGSTNLVERREMWNSTDSNISNIVPKMSDISFVFSDNEPDYTDSSDEDASDCLSSKNSEDLRQSVELPYCPDVVFESGYIRRFRRNIRRYYKNRCDVSSSINITNSMKLERRRDSLHDDTMFYRGVCQTVHGMPWSSYSELSSYTIDMNFMWTR